LANAEHRGISKEPRHRLKNGSMHTGRKEKKIYSSKSFQSRKTGRAVRRGSDRLGQGLHVVGEKVRLIRAKKREKAGRKILAEHRTIVFAEKGGQRGGKYISGEGPVKKYLICEDIRMPCPNIWG